VFFRMHRPEFLTGGWVKSLTNLHKRAKLLPSEEKEVSTYMCGAEMLICFGMTQGSIFLIFSRTHPFVSYSHILSSFFCFAD
jgi:hypothetical protein